MVWKFERSDVFLCEAAASSLRSFPIFCTTKERVNPLRKLFFRWFSWKNFILFFESIVKTLSLAKISGIKLFSKSRTVCLNFVSPFITAIFSNFNLIYFNIHFFQCYWFWLDVTCPVFIKSCWKSVYKQFSMRRIRKSSPKITKNTFFFI